MYSAEDTQVARTIELNDGTRMPVLGLGTWKVALTLIPISALYSTKNPVVISVFSCRLFNVLNAFFQIHAFQVKECLLKLKIMDSDWQIIHPSSSSNSTGLPHRLHINPASFIEGIVRHLGK